MALRDAGGGAVAIERVRRTVSPDGHVASEEDRIELARVTGPELCAEAAPHGLRPGPFRHVAATDEHVGSLVVVLHG